MLSLCVLWFRFPSFLLSFFLSLAFLVLSLVLGGGPAFQEFYMYGTATSGLSCFKYNSDLALNMIFSNSSPSIFSFSINTSATACNTSMLSCTKSLARRYAAVTNVLTSSSTTAAARIATVKTTAKTRALQRVQTFHARHSFVHLVF